MIEQEFDELRPSAFAIAYRMLGSVSEAEDLGAGGVLRLHGARKGGEQIGDAFWDPALSGRRWENIGAYVIPERRARLGVPEAEIEHEWQMLKKLILPGERRRDALDTRERMGITERDCSPGSTVSVKLRSSVLHANGASPLTFAASAINTSQPSSSKRSWTNRDPVIDSITPGTATPWRPTRRAKPSCGDPLGGVSVAPCSYSRFGPPGRSSG
jgi:hypothetical protein